MDHYILRSWQCQNRRCNHQFESGDRYPECPCCHNVRVSWIPGGGHVGNGARSCDAEFRTLVDTFKLNDAGNFRHGEKGQRAKLPTPMPVNGAPQLQFAPGFSAPITPYAVCVPSPGVNFTVKTKVGDRGALTASAAAPFAGAGSIAGNTRIEARHKP